VTVWCPAAEPELVSAFLSAQRYNDHRAALHYLIVPAGWPNTSSLPLRFSNSEVAELRLEATAATIAEVNSGWKGLAIVAAESPFSDGRGQERRIRFRLLNMSLECLRIASQPGRVFQASGWPAAPQIRSPSRHSQRAQRRGEKTQTSSHCAGSGGPGGDAASHRSACSRWPASSVSPLHVCLASARARMAASSER
jgi:hypothetical protein